MVSLDDCTGTSVMLTEKEAEDWNFYPATSSNLEVAIDAKEDIHIYKEGD